MSAEQTTRYEYCELPGPNFIRLLRLHNQTDDADLVESGLETYPLDDGTPPYTTLSYSWGRNKDGEAALTHSILIDGRRAYVSENLHDGLCQLQYELAQGTVRPLFWIDAVCINQSSLFERNSQVARMGKIYARASNMVIWLGIDHESNKDALAFDVLTLFADIGEGEVKVLGDTLDPGNTVWYHMYYEAAQSFRAFFDEGTVFPEEDIRDLTNWSQWTSATELFCNALQDLFKRRYFSRLWVVQEIQHSLTRPIYVLWGPCSIELRRMLESLRRFDLLLQGCMAVQEIPDSRRTNDLRARLRGIQQPLLDLFGEHSLPDGSWHKYIYFSHVCASMKCQDPRDRVYALHSMIEEPAPFQPDYGISVETSYTMLARYIAVAGFVQHILADSAVQGPCTRRSASVLPTWVPDLRINIYPTGVRFGADKPDKVNLEFSQDGQTLWVEVPAVEVVPLSGQRAVRQGPVFGEGDRIIKVVRFDATKWYDYYILRPAPGTEETYKIMGTSYKYSDAVDGYGMVYNGVVREMRGDAGHGWVFTDLVGTDPKLQRIGIV